MDFALDPLSSKNFVKAWYSPYKGKPLPAPSTWGGWENDLDCEGLH